MMNVIQAKPMKLMPAAPGHCSVCATKHSEDLAHNFWSLFYQMHFRLRYGRDATHADTAAHLPRDLREVWKSTVIEAGHPWTEPADGEPIAEPYAAH